VDAAHTAEGLARKDETTSFEAESREITVRAPTKLPEDAECLGTRKRTLVFDPRGAGRVSS